MTSGAFLLREPRRFGEAGRGSDTCKVRHMTWQTTRTSLFASCGVSRTGSLLLSPQIASCMCHWQSMSTLFDQSSITAVHTAAGKRIQVAWSPTHVKSCNVLCPTSICMNTNTYFRTFLGKVAEKSNNLDVRQIRVRPCCNAVCAIRLLTLSANPLTNECTCASTVGCQTGCRSYLTGALTIRSMFAFMCIRKVKHRSEHSVKLSVQQTHTLRDFRTDICRLWRAVLSTNLLPAPLWLALLQVRKTNISDAGTARAQARLTDHHADVASDADTLRLIDSRTKQAAAVPSPSRTREQAESRAIRLSAYNTFVVTNRRGVHRGLYRAARA